VVERGGVDFLRALLADLGQQHAIRCQAMTSVGVVDEAQERHQVADVRLLEELHAARDLVGDLLPRELQLEVERLEMRAVEHGDVAERAALVEQPRTR
jgi:hypothetical protein